MTLSLVELRVSSQHTTNDSQHIFAPDCGADSTANSGFFFATGTEASRSRSRSPRDRSSSSGSSSSRERSSSGSRERPLSSPLRKLLGESLAPTQCWALPIHSQFASSWQEVVRLGLTAEERKVLFLRYPPPDNGRFLDPPLLNEEVLPSMTEKGRESDTKIAFRQRRTGAAIAGLGAFLTVAVAPELKIEQGLLTPLFDAARVLADVFYEDSAIRRGAIMRNLSAPMRATLAKTTPGEYLFGSNLGERIKQARALAQTAAELKPPKPVTPAKNVLPPPKRRRVAHSQSLGGHKSNRRSHPNPPPDRYPRKSYPAPPRAPDYRQADRRNTKTYKRH